MLEHEVPNRRRNNCNHKIRPCEDVSQGEGETLSFPIAGRKFSHQEIRIEQKDDRGRLDHRPPQRCRSATRFWALDHRPIVSNGVVKAFAKRATTKNPENSPPLPRTS